MIIIKNSISINTSNKIKGVSISHEHIAIWDGKIIEISKFDRSKKLHT